MDIKQIPIADKFNNTIPQHGGNISQESKRLGIEENQLIDASASLAPFSPPQRLQNYLCKAIHSQALQNYPDRDHLDLKESISNWHSIEPEMVIPGNGAAELNTWAARDASIIGLSGLPSPGFSDYERALKCWGASFVRIPLPLCWSAEKPQTLPITSNAEVLWITNPHNPTGQLWSRDSLEPLLKKHSLVICDEAFLPLVPEGEQQSLIPLTIKHQNLIVIRSLTKLLTIAGLRLGYAIGSPERLQRWNKWRDPWPLNGIAIATGVMLMKHPTILKKRISKIQKWVEKEGPWLHKNLQSLPKIIAHPSSTNFQLIQSHESLLELCEKLAKRKILIRDCRSFSELGSNWLRISLQKRSNNKKIILSMKEILKQV